MKIFRISAAVSVVLSLSGCLGGGGGDGARPFVSFSAVAPSATTELNGRAVVVEYSTAANGDVAAGPPEASAATVSLTLDDVGALLAALIDVDRGDVFGGAPLGVAFDTADGDTFADGDTLDEIPDDYAVAVNAAGDELAIVADPVAMGFEYQSFGIWATGVDVGSGVAGVATAGAATPSNDLPTADANYSGSSAGFFVDADHNAYLAFADFGASLDFDTQMLTVFTLGTEVVDTAVGGAPTPMDDLDYSGEGMLAGDGTFSIDIDATDLAGSLDGLLNGPGGAELGATFAMQGDAGRYVGAVGAAQ